jgi:TolA-binding protein
MVMHIEVGQLERELQTLYSSLDSQINSMKNRAERLAKQEAERQARLAREERESQEDMIYSTLGERIGIFPDAIEAAAVKYNPWTGEVNLRSPKHAAPNLYFNHYILQPLNEDRVFQFF